MIDPDLAILGQPATAYSDLVTTAQQVLVEVARRHGEALPGLQEHAEDKLLVTTGKTTREGFGTFECGAWQVDGNPVDHIFLNAEWNLGPGSNATEQLLVTLIHELAHASNSMNGIKSTSNRGRYHNRKFAEVAVLLGCSVVRDGSYGHITPGLQAWAQQEYADLITALDEALTIALAPRRASPTKTTTAATTAVVAVAPENSDQDTRYVFASCGCKTSRSGNVTLRMARGSWRPDVTIWCSACGTPFTAGVSSGLLKTEHGGAELT